MASHDWSSLPIDTLSLVFNRLRLLDFVRCRAVCKSWNLVVTGKGCSPSPEPPWLMLPARNGGDILTFFSLTDNKVVCKITLQELELHNRPIPTMSISNGHLIMADKDATQLLVLNPLTGSRIHFPTISNIRNVAATIKFRSELWAERRDKNSNPEPMPRRQLGDFIFSKALLFHTSRSTPPVLAITCGYELQAAFANAGGESWTDAILRGCHDIIFHKGLFYVLSFFGDVLVGNPSATATPTVEIKFNIDEFDYEECYWLEYYPLKFLLESTEGDLLQVWCLDYLNLNVGRDMMYGMKPFVVFKLDSKRSKWSMVTSLGKDVLMLGGKGSNMCVSAEEFPELRSNCIYFTFMSTPRLGVFSLEDGSIEDHPFLDQQMTWQNSYWFIPSVSL